MVRIQIQLEEEQHRRLRRWARRLGISVSEAIRRCVHAELEELDRTPSAEDRIRAVRALAGKYREAPGRRGSAKDHDARLADAYRS